MKTQKEITGYHFTGDKLRNGEPIPKIGVWLKHDGKIKPCVSGLHASEEPFDALSYAPGYNLHKVIVRGNLKSHGENGRIDKWVGMERKIVASLNAAPLLRRFACDCALSVIDKWDAPPIVREYLTTMDESKQAAARAAADAARNAAWAAAAAAWDAARDAWAAAWAAAWDAAWDAAWAAAWDAARAAADAADAARDAAWDAQRQDFNRRIEQAFA